MNFKNQKHLFRLILRCLKVDELMLMGEHAW